MNKTIEEYMSQNHSGDFHPFTEFNGRAFVLLTCGAKNEGKSPAHANRHTRHIAKLIRRDGYKVKVMGDILDIRAH